MSTYTVATKIYRHYNKPSDTPDNEAHFDDLAEATRYFDSKLPELRAKFDCFWTIELTQDSDNESKTLYIATNKGAQ